MPSRKPLKSVVRSFVESFTSLMNYADDDYIIGHIVRKAWSTGATGFHVNLLNGETDASPLLAGPIARSVDYYVHKLPDLVQRSKSDMAFIVSAVLTVTVDPSRRRPMPSGGLSESPYSCSMVIVSDLGQSYSYSVNGWWYPERPSKPPSLVKMVYSWIRQQFTRAT